MRYLRILIKLNLRVIREGIKKTIFNYYKKLALSQALRENQNVYVIKKSKYLYEILSTRDLHHLKMVGSMKKGLTWIEIRLAADYVAIPPKNNGL